MNTKEHMVIIKNRIRTSEVSGCHYDIQKDKWNIRFSDGSRYTYNYENVIHLVNPKILTPNMYRISRDGKELFNIKMICVFGKRDNVYWHIEFQDGSEKDYAQDELRIQESCLNHEKEENVFAYIKEIAKLSELKWEETGEKILARRFEKIGFVGEQTALAKYLNPDTFGTNAGTGDLIPIFPFGCNNSQYKAVVNAMENQISVIQGPPGTGKTQTILNIIANILVQGKTVQIVSNNNSATENVYEKLASPEYHMEFIVAPLGNADNKKAFISRQDGTYPDFTEWEQAEDQDALLEDIRAKSLRVRTVFDQKEELARLRQELAQLETETEYFTRYLEETDVRADLLKAKRKLSSKNWMALWQECQMLSERERKISFWFKIKNLFRYGIVDFAVYRQDMARIISSFQAMYYQTKKVELTARMREISDYLAKSDDGIVEEMCSRSLRFLKDRLAKRYGEAGERRIFSEDDLWKNPYDVLLEYPVILSTTFSSRNSLHADVVYDYLIMDEASQVDIATGALALSCAKNVVIVGDTKQLPNVVTEKTEKQAQEVFDRFHVDSGYRFTNSFLQSVLDVLPNVTQTLLREHYRCHPKIINFCNQKFYRGELIIMTEDHGEEDVLKAVRTVAGNHARDHYSQRQIDIIKEEILPNYVADRSGTGIIAPYRNQVKALEGEFQDMDAATVHKFQGREKDTIIISTVDDELTDFADDPYLINVAVSRARKRLILVVTGNQQSGERNIIDLVDYIQYNNFEVTDSKIYSIFDYLYKQYTEERKLFLQKHRKISEYNSENLMFALMEDILKEDRFACLDILCHLPLNMLIRNPQLLDERECKYMMNPATHLDFVLYNRISKKPVLAVEVDGYGYHGDATVQAERDKMKNHILEVYEIPLLRFKTNGSGERERLVKKLEELLR